MRLETLLSFTSADHTCTCRETWILVADSRKVGADGLAFSHFANFAVPTELGSAGHNVDARHTDRGSGELQLSHAILACTEWPQALRMVKSVHRLEEARL